MMFMTAKVDLKKILLVLGIIAGLIAGALWLLDDGVEEPGVCTLSKNAHPLGIQALSV